MAQGTHRHRARARRCSAKWCLPDLPGIAAVSCGLVPNWATSHDTEVRTARSSRPDGHRSSVRDQACRRIQAPGHRPGLRWRERWTWPCCIHEVEVRRGCRPDPPGRGATDHPISAGQGWPSLGLHVCGHRARRARRSARPRPGYLPPRRSWPASSQRPGDQPCGFWTGPGCCDMPTPSRASRDNVVAAATRRAGPGVRGSRSVGVQAVFGPAAIQESVPQCSSPTGEWRTARALCRTGARSTRTKRRPAACWCARWPNPTGCGTRTGSAGAAEPAMPRRTPWSLRYAHGLRSGEWRGRASVLESSAEWPLAGAWRRFPDTRFSRLRRLARTSRGGRRYGTIWPGAPVGAQTPKQTAEAGWFEITTPPSVGRRQRWTADPPCAVAACIRRSLATRVTTHTAARTTPRSGTLRSAVPPRGPQGAGHVSGKSI